MIYVVKVIEDGETYEYDYGNIVHAEYHYAHERTAAIYEYSGGIEYLVKSKIDGKELEV